MVSVGRSNSAPQAQNRATKINSKPMIHSPLDVSPKSPQTNGSKNLPILSDGIIHVNHNQAAQAAATVLSSHELYTNSSSPHTSSTPLCDSHHSPSSTKRYYQESESMFNLEPQPDDVWQRRDKFASSLGHSVETDSPTRRKTNLVNNNTKESQIINSQYNMASDETTPELIKVTIDSEIAVNGNADEKLSHSLSDTEQIDNEMRKHTQRYPFRQAQSVILPSEMERRLSLAHVKEKGYARLEEELMKAQKALEMKDEEVDELRGIRERLMKEVSDFTASLFEEVNSQLNTAALSEQQARRQLQEANTQIEVLSAEVAALKDLVLTSTPSSPNKHLHPQIDTPKKEKGGKPFWKTHRRSTSHHQFTKESREKAEATQHHSQLKEMDTVVFDEFSRWRLQPTMEFVGQFFTRVQQEDIQPCLNFKNTKLADKILESVKGNTLSIEPIPGDHSYPRKCCLSETHKLCNYKIKFEGDDEWYSISQMSRNRIAAVCDFFSYLRYIVQGLVKCSDKDMYAELVRLREQMAMARLGLI
ncbi:guanine nucleotide exchange factor for Rab-3A-like isoform X2 [Physella acuta]|uniref:guanine nucleotide exchange factor for Rab-3A-like isoform X2 n=1 Tax=Physella acuta TaxID=109671 RepID=UPI0027DBE967|nr:guanine nucleotide exchange factor for Rab-3A-like isoform X2 [Physella acuta]